MFAQLQIGQGNAAVLAAEQAVLCAVPKLPDVVAGVPILGAISGAAASPHAFAVLVDHGAAFVTPLPRSESSRDVGTIEIAPQDSILAGMTLLATPVLPTLKHWDLGEAGRNAPSPPATSDSAAPPLSAVFDPLPVAAVEYSVELGAPVAPKPGSTVLPQSDLPQIMHQADQRIVAPPLDFAVPSLPAVPSPNGITSPNAEIDLALTKGGADHTNTDTTLVQAGVNQVAAHDLDVKVGKFLPIISSTMGFAQSVFLDAIGTETGAKLVQEQIAPLIFDTTTAKYVPAVGVTSPISPIPLNPAVRDIRPQMQSELDGRVMADHPDILADTLPAHGRKLEVVPAPETEAVAQGDTPPQFQHSQTERADPITEVNAVRNFGIAPSQPSADTARLLPTAAPANVTAQIMPLVRAAQNGPVEVLLNPAELGHLRFEIVQKGDQVQVILTAERPETLEMLRRNGEQLVQEMRSAGFSGASISYGQWGQGAASGGKPIAGFAPESDDDSAQIQQLAPLRPARALDSSRALNLRL